MPFNIQKVEIAKLVEPNNYAIELKKMLASVNNNGVILCAFSRHSVNSKVLMANITSNDGFNNLISSIEGIKLYPSEHMLITLKGNNEDLMKETKKELSKIDRVHIDVIENKNFNSLIVDKDKKIYQDNLITNNNQLSLQNKKEVVVILSNATNHNPQYQKIQENKKAFEQLPKASCNIL